MYKLRYSARGDNEHSRNFISKFIKYDILRFHEKNIKNLDGGISTREVTIALAVIAAAMGPRY